MLTDDERLERFADILNRPGGVLVYHPSNEVTVCGQLGHVFYDLQRRGKLLPSELAPADSLFAMDKAVLERSLEDPLITRWKPSDDK